MSERKYTIGVDFGTLSGRALLVDVQTGEEVATAVYEYANGVIDERLPGTDIVLPPDFALQDPADYLRTFEVTIPKVLSLSGVSPADVIGIGIDFTSCTMLPVTQDGTPLCFLDRFRNEPHAWVKLWKHHAAQPKADQLNAIARERGESFLQRYGGKISSEWFFPKVWEILEEAPHVYESADRILEAADWVVWQLTGVEKRNACTAGYKAIWEKETGFVSNDFLAALDPRLADVIDTKMSREVFPPGTRAGNLSPEMAEKLGLTTDTVVAIANVDAHVAVPACTVVEPHRMVMVMGTSICHMVLGTELRYIEGMCGVVEDGILPGYYGYEAGQSAVGDIFNWFVDHAVPAEVEKEAERRGLNVHQVLEERASQLVPGESGLLALDWWNGNRSILVDTDLSGVVLGYSLLTKPEDVYRALIESTAYGTATIVQAFEKGGIPIDELVACGGLPERNKLLMQIYADVTGKRIRVAASAQTPALGSAMFAAVAAGAQAGGYDDITTAAAKMARLKDEIYVPDPSNQQVYRRLFAEYTQLHDYLGRGGNDVLKRLRRIRDEAIGAKMTNR